MVLRLILVAAILSGCAFDAHPTFNMALANRLIGEGEDGPVINPELDGALNKIEAGRPVTLSLTWRFDWFFGRKLPGEK